MKAVSNQEKVREYFRQMKTGTAAQAARALGIPGATARHCVKDLCEVGWLKHCDAYGIYEFRQLQLHEYGRAAKLQETIWRAIRISKTFTAWDIAMYSGASLDYVKDYVKFLKGRGLIQISGKHRQRPVYRIKDESAATPLMRTAAAGKELKHQDIIDLGWDLMRTLRDNDIAKARDLTIKMEGKLNAT
jgi:hypothetical protein